MTGMTGRLMILVLGCLVGVGAVYALNPNTPSASADPDCRTQVGLMETHASSWQGISLRCDERPVR